MVNQAIESVPDNSRRPEWQVSIDRALFRYVHFGIKRESLELKREELEATEPGGMIGAYGHRQPGGAGGWPSGPQDSFIGIDSALQKVADEIQYISKYRDQIETAMAAAVNSFAPDTQAAQDFIHLYWLFAPYTPIEYRRDLVMRGCGMSKATFYRWRGDIYERLNGLI